MFLARLTRGAQAVETGLTKSCNAFAQKSVDDQKEQDELDEALGSICSLAGKSFANIPNALLGDALETFREAIEEGSIKSQGKARLLKAVKRAIEIAAKFAMDADVLSARDKEVRRTLRPFSCSKFNVFAETGLELLQQQLCGGAVIHGRVCCCAAGCQAALWCNPLAKLRGDCAASRAVRRTDHR